MHCQKGKVVKKVQQTFGTCEDCAVVQMPKQTKLTAKLFFEKSDITSHVNVRAYQDMLQATTDKQKTTCENLILVLPLPPLMQHTCVQLVLRPQWSESILKRKKKHQKENRSTLFHLNYVPTQYCMPYMQRCR